MYDGEVENETELLLLLLLLLNEEIKVA